MIIQIKERKWIKDKDQQALCMAIESMPTNYINVINTIICHEYC